MLASSEGQPRRQPDAAGSKNGTVHIWVIPGSGAVDKILLTGVIGDQGTATSMDKDGTVNASGEYVKVALQKGVVRRVTP